MKVRKQVMRMLVAGALLAAHGASFGQGESLQAEAALVKTYAPFAGSQENAMSLVSGLRGGAEVKLAAAVPGCPLPPPVTPPTPPAPPAGPPGAPTLPPTLLPPPNNPPPPPVPPASFTPPTGTMGYGNVDIAINLAQQQLVKAGITQPTPTQLKASFMGGAVSTCAGAKSDLQGILVLRAGKGGWGSIAAKLGLELKE